MKMEHTEALDLAAKEYEERVMLLLSKLSNKVRVLSNIQVRSK